MSDNHERALKALERRGRLRALSPKSGIDFSSNDYLGLVNSRELAEAVAAALDRGVAVGAGGSRLLRGNDPEHEALEAEAAAFFGAESCLYFGGGFLANYALFSTLPARGDLVVHDALIHASVIDGMRAGKDHRPLWSGLDTLQNLRLYPVGETDWSEVAAAIRKRVGGAVAPNGNPRKVLESIADVAESAG